MAHIQHYKEPNCSPISPATARSSKPQNLLIDDSPENIKKMRAKYQEQVEKMLLVYYRRIFVHAFITEYMQRLQMRYSDAILQRPWVKHKAKHDWNTIRNTIAQLNKHIDRAEKCEINQLVCARFMCWAAIYDTSSYIARSRQLMAGKFSKLMIIWENCTSNLIKLCEHDPNDYDANTGLLLINGMANLGADIEKDIVKMGKALMVSKSTSTNALKMYQDIISATDRLYTITDATMDESNHVVRNQAQQARNALKNINKHLQSDYIFEEIDNMFSNAVDDYAKWCAMHLIIETRRNKNELPPIAYEHVKPMVTWQRGWFCLRAEVRHFAKVTTSEDELDLFDEICDRGLSYKNLQLWGEQFHDLNFQSSITNSQT